MAGWKRWGYAVVLYKELLGASCSKKAWQVPRCRGEEPFRSLGPLITIPSLPAGKREEADNSGAPYRSACSPWGVWSASSIIWSFSLDLFVSVHMETNHCCALPSLTSPAYNCILYYRESKIYGFFLTGGKFRVCFTSVIINRCF